MTRWPAFATQQQRDQLLRLAVVSALIVGLVGVGYATAEVNLVLPAVAALVPLGLLILFRRLELGFIGMMLTAVFLRYRIPTGTASEIVLSLVLCGGMTALWVSRMAIIDRQVRLRPSPVNAPLLAFVATVFISLAWSWVFRDPLVHQIGSPFVLVASALVMALLPAIVLLVANLVTDIRWLHIIVGLFIAQGLITLAVTLPSDLGLSFGADLKQLVYRNPYVWVNTQGLFSLWHVSIGLSLALANKGLRLGWRIALLIYVAAWVYWGFFLRLEWLSGWAPIFAATATIVFLRLRKLLIPILMVMIVMAGSYYLRTQYETEAQESGRTRLAAYQVNWRITGQHLLFGTGPGGYASYYMSYFPTEAMASHSNYIDIIAQTGIVGSAALVWFFVSQIRGGIQQFRELKGRGDFAESMTLAALGGTVGCIVAMGLGDWLFPFAYTQTIAGFDAALFNWLFIGAMWAVRDTAPRPAADSLVDGAAA